MLKGIKTHHLNHRPYFPLQLDISLYLLIVEYLSLSIPRSSHLFPISLTLFESKSSTKKWMARANKYTSLNFNDIYEKKIINPNNNNNSSSSRSPSSSSSISSHKSYSLSASSRPTHGGMLLLSRPSPQPQPTYTQKPQPQPQPPAPSQQSTLSSEAFPAITSPPSSKPTDSDSISLRPKGKTGGNPSFQERDIKLDAPSPNPSPSPSPKSSKFVPPHLRPGFVAKEVPTVPDFQKPRQGNYRHGSVHGNYHGSPNRYAEDGRPNSGGGYERKMRGAALGPGPGPGPVAGASPVGAESDSFLMNRPRSGGSRPSSSG
ncbi:unnamed protein product [Amaranthus hypochondriacus]